MRGSFQLTYAVVLLALQDLNTICFAVGRGIAEMSMILSEPFAP